MPHGCRSYPTSLCLCKFPRWECQGLRRIPDTLSTVLRWTVRFDSRKNILHILLLFHFMDTLCMTLYNAPIYFLSAWRFSTEKSLYQRQNYCLFDMGCFIVSAIIYAVRWHRHLMICRDTFLSFLGAAPSCCRKANKTRSVFQNEKTYQKLWRFQRNNLRRQCSCNSRTVGYVWNTIPLEPDIPLSANEIMERLGIKSKETLRNSYLNPAIENGLIRMTLPDKPKSKNQRYFK